VAKTGTDALELARATSRSRSRWMCSCPTCSAGPCSVQLKRDVATRHIPVQIITIEEERQYGLERGAFSFINKPLTTDGLEVAFDRIKRFTEPRVRELLVVEDDSAEQLSIRELIAHDDVAITMASSGAEALNLLAERSFRLHRAGSALPDMTGFELLDRMQLDDASCSDVPVVVFTGRELSDAEQSELKRKAKSIVLKGVQSPERLLDETALFLHRVITDLPPRSRR
jgi:CheY-like chemotaxis protein